MVTSAPRLVQSAIVFVCIFVVLTILNTILWETFVDGTLYNCTDGVGGYPIPTDLAARGDWPLKVVDKVVRDNEMNHPDTILKGWTVRDLWLLWLALFATSILISGALALLPCPGGWSGVKRIMTDL